jgi:hypothetical protein
MRTQAHCVGLGWLGHRGRGLGLPQHAASAILAQRERRRPWAGFGARHCATDLIIFPI